MFLINVKNHSLEFNKNITKQNKCFKINFVLNNIFLKLKLYNKFFYKNKKLFIKNFSFLSYIVCLICFSSKNSLLFKTKKDLILTKKTPKNISPITKKKKHNNKLSNFKKYKVTNRNIKLFFIIILYVIFYKKENKTKKNVIENLFEVSTFVKNFIISNSII